MKRTSILIPVVLMSILAGCGNNQASTQKENIPSSVQDYDMTITLVDGEETFELDGKYTGDMADGKPHGEGVFRVELDDSTQYVYQGSFADGSYNGYGITTIESNGETIEEAGTYTNGEFTPTTGEQFNFVGQLDLFGKFALSEAIIEYIDANKDLFPVATEETIENEDIQEFLSKQFNKTRTQEQIGLVELELYAVQVFEDEFLSGKLTYLLAVDEDGNYYAVYYLGSADVYNEDIFKTYAIPCTTSSFDNISGGITNVIVMAACYIE